MFVGVAVAVALLVLAERPSAALDLDGVDELITETVASRDRLKTYDNIKQYGAERVMDRDRDYATPEGLRAGNYYIHPSIGALITYDDNIFRSDANKVSDFRSELKPGIKFHSSLPRHHLDLSLEGKIVSYLKNPEQDYQGYRAKLDGALHFDHAHTIAANIITALEHEERGELQTPLAAAEPIPMFYNRASIGITRDVGRLYGTLLGTVESRDYQDVRDIAGGISDQDARDTVEYSGALRFGYRFSPGFDFVGKVRVLKSENRGDALFDRDATGFEAMAGLAFETSPLLRWRILGGYGVRDFDDPAIDDVATGLVEAQVQWLPTQNMTLYGIVSRQIIAADAVEPAGRVETVLKGRAEYEIWHNMVLNMGLEYRLGDYVGAFRTDKTLSGSIGLEYFANKNWVFTIGYEHAVRDSTEPLFDMTRNRVMVGAKLRF
ncbi:MAG: outer membrane beta-barrel protein [Hyphomicrobiaceae bacterium]|nr:outer membrane beta-barrel protein [Hyphomicrobiaceae bacterium]